MGTIIKILKDIGLITALILALGFLGTTINDLIQWGWLIDFFSIIKNVLKNIDFIIDTNTLTTLIGLSLYITIGYWTFRATLIIIHWFRNIY